MAENLLIRFTRAAGDEAAEFMVVNDAGQLVVPPRHGMLADAAVLAATRRVIGLLPASDVVTLDAELPAGAGSKLLQAVPYALEEQVADDIDELHFAVGARAADGRTPVCIVARTLMQSIEESCTAAGLSLQALHVETALMSGVPGQLVMLLDGDDMHVCVAGGRAVSLPSQAIAESLSLALGAPAAGEAADTLRSSPSSESLGLLVHATPADWASRGGEIEALRGAYAALKVQLLPQGTLPWLAAGLGTAAPINLLQGKFAPRRNTARGGWRRWRVAAALGATLLLLSAGGNLWRSSRLAAQERAVDAALVDALRPLFPGDANTRDARRRVAAQLAVVRGTGGGAGEFLPALAALAAARSAAPEAELKSLGYRSGSFEVRLKARDAAAIEQIGASLRAGGWATELLGGTGTDQAYEGRIRISTQQPAGGGS